MELNTYCSQDVTELAKAMLKVQATLQPAFKDRENLFTKSRYATLNSVLESCREALIANSIWFSQYPVPVEPGYMGLVTKLTHAESGQWQSSLLVMPLPKADPQGYGSAMTYGRRYSLSALIGIVTDEDDDGAKAGADVQADPRAKSRLRLLMPPIKMNLHLRLLIHRYTRRLHPCRNLMALTTALPRLRTAKCVSLLVEIPGIKSRF
jgi:hypothetical protein